MPWFRYHYCVGDLEKFCIQRIPFCENHIIQCNLDWQTMSRLLVKAVVPIRSRLILAHCVYVNTDKSASEYGRTAYSTAGRVKYCVSFVRILDCYHRSTAAQSLETQIKFCLLIFGDW